MAGGVVSGRGGEGARVVGSGVALGDEGCALLCFVIAC